MKRWTIVLTLLAPLALAPAAAQMLDADSTKKLLVGETWEQPSMAGPGKSYWSWHRDGTLCIRLFDTTQKSCDDTGKWTLDAGRVCYQLGWWSVSDSQDKSGCFRVSNLDGGAHAAIRDDGITMFEFSTLDEIRIAAIDKGVLKYSMDLP